MIKIEKQVVKADTDYIKDIVWRRFSPCGITYGSWNGFYFRKDRFRENAEITKISYEQFCETEME